MFAKFSPDGGRVAYVRENNLYVEDLATGADHAAHHRRLAHAHQRHLRLGVRRGADELLRDGLRWSPDGRRIAYWQLDADGVQNFNLVNNTDSLYSLVIAVQYPKAGEANSAARVGVVPAAGGATRWLDIAGDPRNHYIARMDWAASSGEVILQRLNRLQNTIEVMLGDARTGAVRTVLTERDSAWVDVVDDLRWLDGGKQFTWVSERDGWRHLYAVSRDGKTGPAGHQGQLRRARGQGHRRQGRMALLRGLARQPDPEVPLPEPARRQGQPRADQPAERAGHPYLRSIAQLQVRHRDLLAASATRPSSAWSACRATRSSARWWTTRGCARAWPGCAAARVEWLSIPAENGARMPGVLLKPADFDSTRKYPLLFFVYGGPGNAEVEDQWGGYYLWHTMLTQKGYLVAIVDNRGTPAPLGRAWRKAIYGQLGVLETRDQAAAARALMQRPYVDPARVGIWGWSYGGFMTLNVLFQHPEIYRTGVAVSPVTHWALYDNVYTERFIGLITDNRQGYDRGSPISYVNGFKGNLLLVHGGGDDNVHFQNSEMLINALVAADKPFQMMEYPNRTHCICQGKGTTLHLFTLITNYLDEHLSRPGGRPQDRAATGR